MKKNAINLLLLIRLHFSHNF